MDEKSIPCPYVSADGKPCLGYVKKVVVSGADLTWQRGGEGSWILTHDARSYYYVLCSLKGNHAGFGKPEDPHMKFHWSTLPQALREALLTAHLV